jgi:RNA recognition motif-containing protein
VTPEVEDAKPAEPEQPKAPTKEEKRAVRKREKKEQRKRRDADDGRTVFVRNMAYDVTEDNVREHFEGYGEVEDVKLVKGIDGKNHKGSCFVKFKDEKTAHEVVKISDSYWNHRTEDIPKAQAAELERELDIYGRKVVIKLALTKDKL